MKHRFLIHSLNHTSLLVDISEVGFPANVLPSRGKPQSVSTLRFQTWIDAEQHLLRLGATQESLSATIKSLNKAGVAVLTIT